MSDENDKPDEEATAADDTASTADTPAEDMVPKSAIPSIVQKRLQREQAKHEAELAELRAENERLRGKAKKSTSNGKAQSPQSDEVPAWAESLITTVSELRESRDREKVDKSFNEYADAKGIDVKYRPGLRKLYDPGDTSAADVFAAALATEKTPEKTYKSPGAPSSTSVEVATNPAQWTRDDIARFKAEGTLRERFEKFTSGGVSANPFARKRQ